MRILVTGASGFAGAHVAQKLARDGHEVIGLHRRRTQFLATLDGVSGFRAVACDLALVRDYVDGPIDAVVHTAATSPAPGVDTQRMIFDNVIATSSLVDAALAWTSRAFVFYSSLSRYGTITTPVLDETTPTVDPDTYGATKIICENLLAEQAGRLPSLSLRLPGVLGPGAHRNWMSGLAATLLRGQQVQIFNPDKAFNNAAHVDDISALVARVVTSNWVGADCVVLGAGGNLPVRDAVNLLADGLGVSPDVRIVEAVKPSFLLSSQRAIDKWGYAPMQIDQMVERYAKDIRGWLPEPSEGNSLPLQNGH